jgi:hypothetical protein
VIITTTGAVKVMDFGIARALHGAASTMTQTGMVMGTPQYLSPEQALGKTVDHRSDLYATGCLLYELLTLRPPFVGETPLSVVYQHVQDEPRLPSETNDRVPPELDGLVLRALAKQPEERFQNAEEFRALVGYAHQALTQQGGWTGGAWGTGPLTPTLGSAGTGTAPTMVQNAGPGAPAGGTAELGPPLLAGIGGTGGDDVHGYGEGPGGGRRNRWVKPVLFVVAAVVAVVLGVFLATRGNGSGDTPADTTPPSVTQDTGRPQDTPSDEPTDTGRISTGPTDTQTTSTATTPTATPTTTPPTKATTTPPTTAPTTTPPTTAPTTPTPTQTTPEPTTTAPTAPPTGGSDGGGTG